jgi:hypothetical protein
MKCLKGIVQDNFDPAQEGMIWVYCKESGEDLIPVNYVSPYSAGHRGGMVAIPEAGTMVLIVQPDNSNEWYYQGSIFSQEGLIKDKENLIKEQTNGTVFDPQTYKARGVPQQIIIQDPKGNQLKLSSSYNPRYINNRAHLKSAAGKMLILSDSPLMDCAILRNQHGDGLKITAQEDAASAARSAEMKSRGPQKYISTESQIDIRVIDGRDINVLNTSTGNNAAPGDQSEKYGNVNLESENKDINLTVRAVDGKVFINAKGSDGLVQIDSQGRMYLSGEQGVDIVANAGDINLVSNAGNVNIQGLSVNILAQTTAAVQGTTASLRGSGIAAIDGPALQLNSGLSVPAQAATPGSKEDNDYGD